MLTAYENPADASGGEPFVHSTYRVPPSLPRAPVAERPVFLLTETEAKPAVRARVYTTLATWCPACKKHVPKLQRLNDELAAEGVELIAVPIDEEDDDQTLVAYAKETQLPSRVFAIDPAKRAEATAAFAKALGEPAPLPSTVVTNASGHILAAQPGVPSVSTLRRLLVPIRETEKISAATSRAEK